MKIGIGVIIAIILIAYWWVKDHPQSVPPKQVYLILEQVAA
ncbi:MAG: hypothetical protein WAO98_10885 [Alphaproteobacteria bacterium]